MAQTIKLKRSSTEGKVPIAGNLALGELGINTYDGRIFLKKNDGSDSIEHVVTTDSITTGSITITGTVDAGTLTTTNLIDKQYLDDEVLNASLNAFTQSAITVSGNGTSGSMPVFSATHTVVNSGIRSLTAETIVTHDNDTNVIFTVSGSNGELLTVTDSNTGNLLEVNDTSGLDVFTVSATGDVSASGDITASGFVFDDLTVPGDVTLTGLSAQASEATSLMINSSNVIGTRELGSNAFTSTAFENKASGTHTLVSGSSQVIGILSSLNSFSASNGNASLNAYTQSAASVNNTTITLTGGIGVNSLGNFTLNQSSAEAFVFSIDSSSLAGNVLTAATDGTGLDVTVGDGIEVNSSALRVKLDGSTIDRTSNGIKLSDENLNTSLNSFSASNGNDSLNSFTASNANTSLNTFTASNANTSLNAATSSYLTAHPSITQGSNISSDNSNGTVIQDLTITLDSNGHVTEATAGTVNLDGRYYTETESDARFEDIASGTHKLVSGSSQVIGILSSLNSFSASNGNTSLNSFTASNANTSLNAYTQSSTLDDVSEANLRARLADITEDVTIGDSTDVDITFAGGVTVTGDLTVSGTTTSVNSNEVNIGDSTIILNSDETGTPSQDGGIEIERGTATNASLIWDESNDYFVAGLSGSQERIVVGAGNTSITTLGTIGTGTWNGTAIDKAYLDDEVLNTSLNAYTQSDGSVYGLDVGIDNLNVLQANATVADNSFLRIDGSKVEGLTAGEVKTALSLTKGDVGLGNVENTAISTFAGSSNITTVGTIGTGTWNGTAIDKAYLDDEVLNTSLNAATGSYLTSTAITITTAAQPNITSLGTLTTLTVDDITIDGSTISDTGEFTLDVGADINLDADGGDIILRDGGTIVGTFSMNQNGGDFDIRSRVQDKDLRLKGNDGGSEITALTLDMSNAGAATFNSTVTATGATLTNLSNQSSEATALMINGSNVVGTRELGSNAFNSTAFTTNTGTVTSVGTNTGLSGTVTTTGNLSLALSDLADMTQAWVTGEDEFIVLDNGTQKRKLSSEIFGSAAFSTATDFVAVSGDAMTGNLTMGNNNISNVNQLLFNDPGPDEGLAWSGGNFKIYESPDDLTTNTAGNLQFVSGSSRVVTIGGHNETTLYVEGDTFDGTVLDIQGTEGQLFSVTDNLTSGDLFTVADISGVPVFAVSSSGESTFDGDVNLGDSNKLLLGDDDDLQIYHDGTTSYIDNNTGHLYIRNNADDDDGGNIYIQAKSGENGIVIEDDAAVSLHYNNSLKLQTKSTGVDVTGELAATGDVIAYSSSDKRLKENIKPIENATEKIKQIGGYTFDWKEGIEDVTSKTGNDIGVIAQEIEEVAPQLVTTRDNGFKGVDYPKLVALLIESNKELTARIEDLESKLK